MAALAEFGGHGPRERQSRPLVCESQGKENWMHSTAGRNDGKPFNDTATEAGGLERAQSALA